jgi:hypothetical protein
MEKPKIFIQRPAYSRDLVGKVHRTDYVVPARGRPQTHETKLRNEDAAIKGRNQRTKYCGGYLELDLRTNQTSR